MDYSELFLCEAAFLCSTGVVIGCPSCFFSHFVVYKGVVVLSVYGKDGAMQKTVLDIYLLYNKISGEDENKQGRQ